METIHLLALVTCVFLAFAFEFVNGFHDTANAVATVIYTRALSPKAAVTLSGVCNFLGVFVGGIAVAIGIINLLPVEIIADTNQSLAFAMLFALLLSAIIWNLGTWYFGIPASSSHTLIGSILGIGLAYSMMPGHVFGHGVNWSKAIDIGLSLLISPLVGFGLAALMVIIIKKLFPNPDLHHSASLHDKPPFVVRAILTISSAGVSFAHGSNDGQKGIGLVMLILIAAYPAKFALDPNLSAQKIQNAQVAVSQLETEISSANSSQLVLPLLADLKEKLGTDFSKDAIVMRSDILLVEKQISQLVKSGFFQPSETPKIKSQLAELRKLTDYAPSWVMLCIALALGLGTMFGWKRVVVTVGTRIGKSHMSYAQGISAQMVASSTIGLAAIAGLPVSTTHVLSSGVAGTMVAQKAGLDFDTVKKIGLAWVLTLPVTMLLSGVFFWIFKSFV